MVVQSKLLFCVIAAQTVPEHHNTCSRRVDHTLHLAHGTQPWSQQTTIAICHQVITMNLGWRSADLTQNLPNCVTREVTQPEMAKSVDRYMHAVLSLEQYSQVTVYHWSILGSTEAQIRTVKGSTHRLHRTPEQQGLPS